MMRLSSSLVTYARSSQLSQASIFQSVQGLCSAKQTASPTSPSNGSGSVRSVAVMALGGAVLGVTLQQTLFQRPQPSSIPSNTATPSAETQPTPQTTVSHSSTPSDAPVRSPPSRNQQAQEASALALPSSQAHTPRADPADAAGAQGPWVIDEEMELIMHRRTVTKNRLVAYLDSMQKVMHAHAADASRMGKYGEAYFNAKMAEMEPMVDLQAQMILFGIDEPNARKTYLEQYGCTRWTDAALDAIKAFGPIIEIGAGHGHWQQALAQKGVDVLAFDDSSALPMDGMPNVGVVKQGNEKELRKHPRRALLLVYPGTNDMAANCLKEYKGNHLLYVGESRGGVNASTEFFDMLQKDWQVESAVPVIPFPEGYEKLYVMRRKGQGRKSKGWWFWR